MIDLATLQLTPAQATRNILMAGVPGTGKTVLVWFMLQSIIRLISKLDLDILLTDPKKENAPIINADLPNWVPVWLTHPMDRRSSRPAFGKIYRTYDDAERLSDFLILDSNKSSEKYWQDISRQLNSFLIQYNQMEFPGTWTLHDLVDVGTDAAKLQRVLGRFAPSRSMLKATFKDKEHRGKVVSSLGSHLGKYRALAKNWQQCTDEFTFDNFLSSRSVLLLGHDEKYPSQFARLNSLMVSELAATILSRRDQSKWHYIILDEFALLRGYTDIRELLLKGRDSNVSVTITFQSPSSLISSLGRDKFDEITSMCQFKVFMKMSPDGAKWASEQSGKREVKEGNSIKEKPVISPDDIINLPLARGPTIEGYIVSPFGAPASFKLPFRQRLNELLRRASGQGFEARS
jgi:type IV secretory pathway TraG/TraD family ATPase VirD4